MVEGGMKCVKILLFAFNLVFVIAAIGLIASGAYVQIELKDYFDLIEGQFSSAAALLIAVGVIIFFIASFGCCGAFKENYMCVMIFAVLLGIVFVLEIAGGIAGFVMKDKVKDIVNKSLKESLHKYHPDSQWDGLQETFQCCGVSNYTDWYESNGGPMNGTTVPKSCCKKSDKACTGENPPTGINTEACLTKFVNYLESKVYIVGGVGIGLAFIQIVGILFACCLARSIKKEYEVV